MILGDSSQDPEFSGSTSASPARVWEFSGNEKGLLENWSQTRERSWTVSSGTETATAFLILEFF